MHGGAAPKGHHHDRYPKGRNAHLATVHQPLAPTADGSLFVINTGDR